MTTSFEDEERLVQNEELQDDLLDNRFGGYGIEQNIEVLHTNTNIAPLDRYNFTYLVFYLLGAATMASWNFFVTAEDYWLYKFRNMTYNGTDPLPDLTPMQKNFSSDLTVTASVAGTTFLILNAVYGHHVTLRLKMLGMLMIILLIFIVTTIFVQIDTDDWQYGFFLMTMGTVVVINIASAVLSGGLFGIAGLFPSEYMTAVVSGQALGGIFTALAFILTLTFGAPAKTTAFVYFSIGNFIILLSIVTYVIMSRQQFFKYYVGGQVASASTSFPESGCALEPNFKEVFSKIYLYCICICILFATTLSVYPAVTILMESQNAGHGYKWNDIYFMPVVNYLCFNSGDYLGRIFAGLVEKPRNNPHLVFLVTITRLVFIPLFMMSNSKLHYYLPTLVHSDIVFIGLMISFAISNGYFANIILIMAPKSVMQHEKEMASSIMAASFSLGLAFGAIVSMALVQLL